MIQRNRFTTPLTVTALCFEIKKYMLFILKLVVVREHIVVLTAFYTSAVLSKGPNT